MSSKACIGYMKTWMLSTNIEVIMIHLPCCTSLVQQMVALWMIALYSDTSEYGRTLAKKIRLRRLNQPKIPYIRTKPSPSGPKIPYLQTGIWSFLGPKIPYFPDRHASGGLVSAVVFAIVPNSWIKTITFLNKTGRLFVVSQLSRCQGLT